MFGRRSGKSVRVLKAVGNCRSSFVMASHILRGRALTSLLCAPHPLPQCQCSIPHTSHFRNRPFIYLPSHDRFDSLDRSMTPPEPRCNRDSPSLPIISIVEHTIISTLSSVPTSFASLYLPFSPLQHTSQTSSSQSTIDSSTKKQLSDLDAAVAKNREEVIKKIVTRVVKCEPKLHQNLKKVEA